MEFETFVNILLLPSDRWSALSRIAEWKYRLLGIILLLHYITSIRKLRLEAEGEAFKSLLVKIPKRRVPEPSTHPLPFSVSSKARPPLV